MHAAIELSNMRLTHVHTDSDILGGLVYLESAKLRHVLFDDTQSPNFLDGLTTLELGLLYQNLTGVPFPPTLDDLAKREALAQRIEGVAVVKVNAEELAEQITAVFDELEAPILSAIQYRYVPGARVPRVLDDGLFPLTTAPASAEQLTQAATAAPQRRALRSAAPVAAPAAKPAAPARTGGAVRRGSVAQVIIAHAEKVWEAAGKPTDVDVVLKLRAQMYEDLLSEHGIKKSTSSTTLGGWMKTRLASN